MAVRAVVDTLFMIEPQAIYQSVVARRLQWDNLLWQVPILSLTAQAFLFTIALGADTSRVSRTVAAVLSIVVTVLCVTLMARHRQAELADAHWLEEFEKSYPPELRIHGTPFVQRREAVRIKLLDKLVVPLWPGYRTWTWGLIIFGLGSVVVVIMTWMDPSPLSR